MPRDGGEHLSVRIDERTAGYLAIGLAVAEGAPVCVAMTSGTAVANLGPAVVEANYARVPLIVLSANRPYELLGTGAGIGIRKGDTALKEKFDAALAALIASGEYKTINEKYIPVDIAPK